jgi:hypothetical protein
VQDRPAHRDLFDDRSGATLGADPGSSFHCANRVYSIASVASI